MENLDLAAMIQYSLTPGIMISSSALFLLGLQTRFSNLFSRVRTLNHERRSLESSSEMNTQRLKNLNLQLDRLMDRVACVKNAIFCFYFAILSFIATVLCLFLEEVAPFSVEAAGLGFFITGMMLILAAVFFLLREISLGAAILELERRS